MGESSAETVKEIEQTRERLGEEIRELEDRLPRPAVWVKRAAGVALGGGAAGTVFWFAVRRRRTKKAEKAKARPAPVEAVVRMIPEGVAEKVSSALEDGRWRTWAAGAGGVWLVFRLAELRQMRRMNRALLGAR